MQIGAVEKCSPAQLVQGIRPSFEVIGWLNPIHPRCANPPDRTRARQAMDSRKMRHKRPFPALPISLIRGPNRFQSLMNQPQITPELVASHGLKPDEYQRILKLIGRVPSFTELGIFSAMWNEH